MRPVEMKDAEFIVHLRRMPHARGNIGDTSESLDGQKSWLQRYFNRENEYYWILTESETGRSVGTCALYSISDGVGEPGRWVVYPDACFSIAATDLLVYRFAFDQLGLDRLIFNVVADNAKVLKFHRLFGAREFRVQKNGQVINGRLVDFIWFEVTKKEWPALFSKWDGLIR